MFFSPDAGSSGSDQISHVHRHLLNRRAVKGFNVLQRPFVLCGHEVDGSSLSPESTTTSDSVQHCQAMHVAELQLTCGCSFRGLWVNRN